MKKVVFCWELGANYGHITSFLPFYRELIKAGFTVDMVLRDLSFAQSLLADTGVRFFQAPLPRAHSDTAMNTYTYTDLLAQVGYLDATRLTGYVGAWRNLLQLLDADLIIANHAPTAILAAHTLALPTVMFGSGFCMPPLNNPMPIFHVWNTVPEAIAHQHEAAVLASINKVLVQYDRPVFNAIADMFAVAERFLCTTSELDHYLQREGDDYWGPSYIDDIGIIPEWPRVQGVRIFAYLTAKISSLNVLLDELAKVPGSKLLHIPNASEELIARYQAEDLRIEPEPVNMKTVVTEADLVIHQSGIGTLAACTLAGVRQVLVPTQLEQRMMCKKLVAQGLAYGVDPDACGVSYTQAITNALSCTRLATNLAQFKQKYAGFDQQERYAVMAEIVADILAE